MNRLVLALLALFAGLCAQVSPARAQACGNTEIGASIAASASARVIAVAAAAPFRPILRRETCAAPSERGLANIPAIALRGVFIGADRARE